MLLVVFLQNIVTFTLHIIFKCKKNRPHFEIHLVVYLLILTAMALVTSGKSVTSVVNSYYTDPLIITVSMMFFVNVVKQRRMTTSFRAVCAPVRRLKDTN